LVPDVEITRRTYLVRAATGIGVVGLSVFCGCQREPPTQPAAKVAKSAKPAEPRHLRLTLRVLLAYRDGILEPADMEDVGGKLRQSDFASKVNAHIDAVVQNHADDDALAHDAPTQDANDIAEYLDNVMAADKVVPLETACLQNDSALAEVAACHNLVATLLTRPAQIAPEEERRLRDRAYQIPTHGAGS